MFVSQLPIMYTVSEMTVAVFAVVGNLVVMIAFGLDRRIRKVTNFYILSLAMADFLVGLVGVPSAILTKLGLPEGNFSACMTMLSLLVVLCTISILNLLAVSVDRYWAVIRPFSYQQTMTGRTVAIIVFVCWVLGSAIGFFPLFGWNSGPEPGGRCFFAQVMNYDFLVFLYFVTIVYPTLVMVFFYGKIYLVVLKQLRQISSLNQAPSTYVVSRSYSRENPSSNLTSVQRVPPNNKKDISTAKKLSIIVIFFVLCWLPLYTINCVQAFCRTCIPPSWLLDCFIVLSHANSAVNPFLYAYHLREFRNAINQVLCFFRNNRNQQRDYCATTVANQEESRTSVVIKHAQLVSAKNRVTQSCSGHISRLSSDVNIDHT